jgi:hypothetical protein
MGVYYSILCRYTTLIEIGQKFSVASIKPVHETRDELSRRVFALENEGSTALGMAHFVFYIYILFHHTPARKNRSFLHQKKAL